MEPESGSEKSGSEARPRQSKVARAHQELDVNWEAVNLADINLADHTFQYRFVATTADLRRSLETDGQEEPVDLLRGTGKPFRIIDGFRRCAAALELGWSTIKAFVHDFDDDKAMRYAFTKNWVRKGLSPMECA